MDAKEELINRWRNGTPADRERILYLLRLARWKERIKQIEEMNRRLKLDE